MKRISLESLLHSRQELPYQEQYEHICRLLEEEKIKPVKASRTNGKKPALYREYWIVEAQKDYSSYIEELKYSLSTNISVDYYLSHLDIYEKDRPWIIMLDDYLKNNSDRVQNAESMNERSFEIWNREKFLDREQGKRILKRCGIELESLNIYRTSEPMPYYAHIRNTPQNLLFWKIKTLFSVCAAIYCVVMQRFLVQKWDTLIYGAGKGILRSFQDFDFCAEPYMRDPRNQIFYFGDLVTKALEYTRILQKDFRTDGR